MGGGVDDGDFVVAGGDTYLADLAPPRELTSSRLISISVKEVENPRQYGVAVVRNGVIVRVVEKPKEPPSNIAILPFYKFPRNFFKYLARVRSGVGGEAYILYRRVFRRRYSPNLFKSVGMDY